MLGHWKKKAGLEVLERKKGNPERQRREKMDEEDEPDPRGFKESRVAMDTIEGHRII